MKKCCIIFLSAIILILSAVGLFPKGETKEGEYLRIHIRANSNEACDQQIKYEVRDDVVEYLTPLVADCQTRAEAEERISAALPDIGRVAQETLQKKGYSYGARAEVTTEEFPTRVYGEYVLPSGKYRCLILYLGEGTGDNWWCVVYPPLCFTATQDVVYKSKIVEIIKRWQAGTS